MRIMFLSPTADATTDIHNPDATLRARSLCALELGSRFHPSDATHASGGTIYDPKSGNTYRGQMLWKGTSSGCAAMLDSHCSAERRFGIGVPRKLCILPLEGIDLTSSSTYRYENIDSSG